MTLSQTIRPATALAAFAMLAATVIPASTAPMGKPGFDGAWSVLIVTENGKCDRAYRYPVKIENGAVGYAGSSAFDVTGKVGSNGAITVTVSKAGKSATGTGHISSNDGSGKWTAAGGECSGTWTAERRS